MLLRKNTIENDIENEKINIIIQMYHIGKIKTNDCCAFFQLILFLKVYLWHINFSPCKISYMVQFVILEFSSCLNAYEKHDSCLNAYENTFHLHVVIYLVIHCMYMMNVFIRWMYFTNIHESKTQTPQSLTFLMWQCLFTAEIFVLVPHYLHQESCLSQLLEIS